MAHIQDKEMVLRYHQFSTDDIRTIAKALCVRKQNFSFMSWLIRSIVDEPQHRTFIPRWKLFTTSSSKIYFSND